MDMDVDDFFGPVFNDDGDDIVDDTRLSNDLITEAKEVSDSLINKSEQLSRLKVMVSAAAVSVKMKNDPSMLEDLTLTLRKCETDTGNVRLNINLEALSRLVPDDCRHLFAVIVQVRGHMSEERKVTVNELYPIESLSANIHLSLGPYGLQKPPLEVIIALALKSDSDILIDGVDMTSGPRIVEVKTIKLSAIHLVSDERFKAVEWMSALQDRDCDQIHEKFMEKVSVAAINVTNWVQPKAATSAALLEHILKKSYLISSDLPTLMKINKRQNEASTQLFYFDRKFTIQCRPAVTSKDFYQIVMTCTSIGTLAALRSGIIALIIKETPVELSLQHLTVNSNCVLRATELLEELEKSANDNVINVYKSLRSDISTKLPFI